MIRSKHLRITKPESLVCDVLGAIRKIGACLFDRPPDLFFGNKFVLYPLNLIIQGNQCLFGFTFGMHCQREVIKEGIDGGVGTTGKPDGKLIIYKRPI